MESECKLRNIFCHFYTNKYCHYTHCYVGVVEIMLLAYFEKDPLFNSYCFGGSVVIV